MNSLSLTALLPSLDPALVTIICAIFLFAGVVKGFLGIGLPAAAMGLLTLVIPPTEAISLLWLPILFTNIVQFGRAPERRSIATSYIWFAVPLAASIFLTSLFINDYPTALLTVAIGSGAGLAGCLRCRGRRSGRSQLNLVATGRHVSDCARHP